MLHSKKKHFVNLLQNAFVLSFFDIFATKLLRKQNIYYNFIIQS